MRSIFVEKPDPLELRLRLANFRGKLWVWLPALIAVIIIANESTGRFSANNTSSYLRPIVERYFGHIRDNVWEVGHHLFRKSGHFLGFGLLCLTFVRAWLLQLGCVADLPRDRWHLRSVLLGLLCQIAVAGADEYHQTFVPGRTGQLSDVLLDTCGGVLACTLVWLLLWRKGKRRSGSGGSRRRIASRGLA